MSDRAADVEPHIPALRRYARALLRNQDAADDLVQDCLERALGHWHLRRPEPSSRAWLFAILRNLHLNNVRQQSRRGTHIEFQDADGYLSNEGDGERTLIVRDALQALATLPEEQRSLLLLVAVDDFSYQEAADLFKVPPGTIMSRLSRARANFRSAIDGGARVTLRRVK